MYHINIIIQNLLWC